MSSEFQKRKVAGVFYALDVDQDGYLEEEDFQCLTDRWNEIRELPAGHARARVDHGRDDGVVAGPPVRVRPRP